MSEDGKNTHTHNRQCPICKGLCKFAKLNSAEAPYEEIEAAIRRRRRLESLPD